MNLENEFGEVGALLRFWIRYVNDVLAIIKRKEAGTILEKLNRAHGNIELIIQIEKEGEMPFLDLKIIQERGDFEFDIYRKPTRTPRTITYASNHDFHHKMIHSMVTAQHRSMRRGKIKK